MFPFSPHNYCSSKLTSAPLFGSARSHTHTIPRLSATGSSKHRWRPRYGAGSLLVGSTTCSARSASLACVGTKHSQLQQRALVVHVVLRWPAWARSTANCNNAQKKQDPAPNAQAILVLDAINEEDKRGRARLSVEPNVCWSLISMCRILHALQRFAQCHNRVFEVLFPQIQSRFQKVVFALWVIELLSPVFGCLHFPEGVRSLSFTWLPYSRCSTSTTLHRFPG